jgi:hypothetical protein
MTGRAAAKCVRESTPSHGGTAVPAEFSITPALPTRPDTIPALQARPAAAATAPVTATAQTQAAPLRPSPSELFNPALGLVVLEFLGSQGQVVNQIPSQKQIDVLQNQLFQGASGQSKGLPAAQPAGQPSGTAVSDNQGAAAPVDSAVHAPSPSIAQSGTIDASSVARPIPDVAVPVLPRDVTSH